jgi:hypothetical protein
MELPDEDTLRRIVRTTARLRAAHGEAIGEPELVQPTGRFFPDEFRLDAPSVARLLRRMIEYSPLADNLAIEIAFHESESTGGGCGSSACESRSVGGPTCRVDELEEGYRVHVAVSDVGHAELLAASLARSVGALVLHESGDPEVTEEADVTSELAAVSCGFGVLLANGAAAWAKSCGGLRMARATLLSVEEIAVALGLFVAIGGVRPAEARAHLGATQREALEHALAWTESNPLIVETLRDRPALLCEGHLDLEPVRGALGRWLHKRKIDREMKATPSPASKPALSSEKQRRLEEARALVDEVLGE